ncbi:MAG: HNH endonuclease [Acidobacteriota bacterium]
MTTRISLHHLVPRERDGKDGPTVMICLDCHGHIHAVLGNKELARELRAIDLLRSHPEIARFVRWVRKQDPERAVRLRQSRARR